MTDHTDLLQRMKDSLAAYGLIENGDLREAIEVIEKESAAADMIAEERDAWEKRAKTEATLRLQCANDSQMHLDRALAAEADNAALRQLLADMKPHWDGFTRKVIWTAAMAGVMADIRTRLDDALLAGKEKP